MIDNMNTENYDITDLYKKFYRKYGNKFNLEIKKSIFHTKDIHDILNNLHTKVISLDNIEMHEYLDDGGRIDGKLTEYSDPDNPTNLYTKQNKYDLPNDLKLFYKMFDMKKIKTPWHFFPS